jgi:hypothetical protein
MLVAPLSTVGVVVEEDVRQEHQHLASTVVVQFLVAEEVAVEGILPQVQRKTAALEGQQAHLL